MINSIVVPGVKIQMLQKAVEMIVSNYHYYYIRPAIIDKLLLRLFVAFLGNWVFWKLLEIVTMSNLTSYLIGTDCLVSVIAVLWFVLKDRQLWNLFVWNYENLVAEKVIEDPERLQRLIQGNL